MRDEVIMRMVQDACQKLEDVFFPVEMPNVAPTYNALLAAIKANHPDEPFLYGMSPIEGKSAAPEELKILFGQLRIIMETLAEGTGGGSSRTQHLGR